MIRSALLLQVCYFGWLGAVAGERMAENAKDRAEMLILLSMPIEQLSNLPI